jgi:acetyl-CoA carboxylase biotin carboxyl carrier protein
MKYEEIKKLMDDMGNSKIDNLDIEFPDGIKISMSKNNNVVNSVTRTNEVMVQDVPVNTTMNVQVAEIETTSAQTDNDPKIVKSPMVGTFYSSSSPDKPTFVKVGDIVKKGDTLCILEAMKLMNEIESEYDGEIVEILVRNGDMVEYGMPLFRIK